MRKNQKAKKELDSIPEDLVVGIVNGLIESSIAHGDLDPKGKGDAELRDDIIRLLKASRKFEFAIAVDYRWDLLERARKLKRSKKFQEAVMYYATWVEHTLNWLINSILRRKKCSADIIKTFIGGTHLHAKYIFFCYVYCKVEASKEWIKKLGELSNKRNQFIHFKWSYFDDDAGAADEKSFIKAARDAEKIVAHLKYLEEKYIDYRKRMAPFKKDVVS